MNQLHNDVFLYIENKLLRYQKTPLILKVQVKQIQRIILKKWKLKMNARAKIFAISSTAAATIVPGY